MIIEKGITVPKRTRTGAIMQLASQMSAGDSVLVKNTQCQALQKRLRGLGFRSVSRKEGNGRRVWVIGKQESNQGDER
jgi:hypothetical protein